MIDATEMRAEPNTANMTAHSLPSFRSYRRIIQYRIAATAEAKMIVARMWKRVVIERNDYITMNELCVAFGAIVRLAEHLAVGLACIAALRPCRHMVGLHLLEVVEALRVGGGADDAKRAV